MRVLLPALFAALIAIPAAAETIALGGIGLSYDPARWNVRPAAGVVSPGQRLVFTCLAPECRRERTELHASATPAAGPSDPACADDARPLDHDTHRLEPPPGPLALSVRVEFSGCRAYTPAAYRACAYRDGVVYRFASGVNFGCRGIEGVGEAMFREILSGITIPASVPR